MLQVNFHPFPELETGRLLLRKITPQDAPEIFFLRSNADVMKYIDRERAKSVKDAEEFIKKIINDILSNDAIIWSIDLKENPGKLIGTICLWQFQKEHFRAETGYVLHPDHWRKGYMKEALEKVLDFGFDTLKLSRIFL